MLNHKFYFEGAEKEEEGCYIRISKSIYGNDTAGSESLPVYLERM